MLNIERVVRCDCGHILVKLDQDGTPILKHRGVVAEDPKAVRCPSCKEWTDLTSLEM